MEKDDGTECCESWACDLGGVDGRAGEPGSGGGDDGLAWGHPGDGRWSRGGQNPGGAIVTGFGTPKDSRAPDEYASQLVIVGADGVGARLTAAGRRLYSGACAALGISPESVKTLETFKRVERKDAEMCVQMLLETGESPFSQTIG